MTPHPILDFVPRDARRWREHCHGRPGSGEHTIGVDSFMSSIFNE